MKMFYEKDADVDLIKNKKIAIFGYGSQGHAHAINLSDSGIKDVVVGLRDGSSSVSKAKDAGLKLCRVDGKTTIKGGVTQLNLHDGRNMLVDDANKYNTMDALVVEVGSQKVKKHHKFEAGANCYLIGGSHIGSTATMTEYAVKRSSKDNEVLFGDFGTIVDHVFVVGDASLPLDEVNA